MEDSKIFDKTYEDYLSQLEDFDFLKKAEILGVQKRNQSFVFDFFNRKIAFNRNDFIDMAGEEVTFAVKVVLCKYLLMCPEKVSESSNRLVTFREFSNAGPLFSNFTANTNKIIETSFSGQLESLKTRCQELGGTLMEAESYDLSVRFRALHRIPIILNFNDKDELLPAKSIFLFHDNAEIYLDLECLAITSTYLTGLLIKGE
ncbi:MAG: hypothetical protein DRH93_11240 [Deltaproteobacteria bacterium]|nr:MAG: hypothetical protein DRH93_11240 [Deltaproteobacteria bacterium]